MKFCMNCGTQLPDAAKFCLACGAKQDATLGMHHEESSSDAFENPFIYAEETPAPPKPRVKKPLKVKKWMPIVSNSLIVVIALLFLVFSFFPIIRFNTESILGDEADFEVKFSITDATVFLFDSFKDLSTEDLQDSRLYEEMMDLMSEMEEWDAESIDELSRSEMRDMTRFVTLMLRISLQHEETPTSLYLVLGCVVGILYILICIAFLTISILNLLSSLNVLKTAKKALYNWTMVLLCLTPMLLLGLYYSIYFFFNDGSSIGVTMCGGSLTAFILSMVIIAMLATMRFLFVKSARTSIRIVPTTLTVVAAILILCFTFVPILSTNLRATFASSSTTTSSSTKEATIKVDTNIFSSFGMDGLTLDSLDSVKKMTTQEKQAYFSSRVAAFNQLTYKQAEGGAGSLLNITLLRDLTVVKGVSGIEKVLSLVPLLSIMAYWGTLITLGCVCYYLVTGKNMKALSTVGKSIALFFSLAFMVVVIVYLAIVNNLIDTYFPSKYTLSMGAGSILTLVSAIFMFCVPSRLIRKQKKAAFPPVEPVVEAEEQAPVSALATEE